MGNDLPGRQLIGYQLDDGVCANIEDGASDRPHIMALKNIALEQKELSSYVFAILAMLTFPTVCGIRLKKAEALGLVNILGHSILTSSNYSLPSKI